MSFCSLSPDSLISGLWHCVRSKDVPLPVLAPAGVLLKTFDFNIVIVRNESGIGVESRKTPVSRPGDGLDSPNIEPDLAHGSWLGRATSR
jgi:hypothetical protein